MEYIKLADFIYLTGSNIFTGLECGIITSHLFYASDKKIEKMSLSELYIRLLAEICFITVVIYFLVPLLSSFRSPLEGFYGYNRNDDHKINANVLFIVSYLLGARMISEKVTAIINKVGFFNIKETKLT